MTWETFDFNKGVWVPWLPQSAMAIGTFGIPQSGAKKPSTFDSQKFASEFKRLRKYWPRERAAKEAVVLAGGKAGEIREFPEQRTALIDLLDNQGNVIDAISLGEW